MISEFAMHRILLTLNLWISRILSYYTVHLERWKCKMNFNLKKEKIILLLHLSFRYVLIMFLSTVNRREENQSIPPRSTFDNWLISKRRERKNDSIKREKIQCMVQVNIRSDFIKNNFTIIQIILKSPCLIFMSRFPFRYPTTLVWNCKTADALLWANLF